MNQSYIVYILFFAALGTGISAKCQEQKKPSERSFNQEMFRIKQIQKERTLLIDRTKTQTSENIISPGIESAPGNIENHNSSTFQSPQLRKPSSGVMQKPQKPIPGKG